VIRALNAGTTIDLAAVAGFWIPECSWPWPEGLPGSPHLQAGKPCAQCPCSGEIMSIQTTIGSSKMVLKQQASSDGVVHSL
jgi:hypothetical protein